MKDVILVLSEQFKNVGMIFRMSKYDERATYQSHYLGLLWQFLNPLVQVGIYYLIFGLGFYGGREVEGVSFLVWMMIGLSTWFYMSTTILGTSNSIYYQVYLVSKMRFPVSILPSIKITSNLTAFFVMMIATVAVMLSQGVSVTLKWLQLPYYFLCMMFFMFSIGIFSATITVLIRDYHMVLQSIIRVLLYISGVFWNIKDTAFNPHFKALLELNPIFYIIDGYRTGFLSGHWLWEDPFHALFFWGFSFLLLLIGCHLHIKFRSRFVDFV